VPKRVLALHLCRRFERPSLGLGLGHAKINSCRSAHVKRGHFPAQQAVDPVQAGKGDEGAGRFILSFGQGKGLPGAESQVPAPVADPFGRCHLALQRWRRVKQLRQRLYLLAGPRALDPQHVARGILRNRFELVA